MDRRCEDCFYFQPTNGKDDGAYCAKHPELFVPTPFACEDFIGHLAGLYMCMPHKTNYDRLRYSTKEQMADELVSLFAAFYDAEWSKEAVLEWLDDEVEDGT